MNLGKTIRLERIINRETGHTIIVPMDHGVSMGPLKGLVDAREAVTDMVIGGADAVLMHKGLVRCGHRGAGRDVGLIVHLSASTSLSPSPNSKSLVATVEEGIRLGADCVSVHVNLGDPEESRMLADFGRVAESCEQWGMPLLAMVYARGPKILNPFDADVVALCARVGAELGADIVKVPYTGSIESFRKVTSGCAVPVVIAGGERVDSTEKLLRIVKESMEAGGAGLSIGRNVFQHPQRIRLMQALRGLVHEGKGIDDALAMMEE
ncbi:MAG: 2-amino-3,7-dideoxy-D-threo-hept-6-ulosonate synthase [Desulfovibrionaceae bacterium]|nr:2-amino-3,7-dideoxy-D-threo-hept-6-ulosonate synthase [Desulfovibrionaceae bacterium]